MTQTFETVPKLNIQHMIICANLDNLNQKNPAHAQLIRRLYRLMDGRTVKQVSTELGRLEEP